MGFLDDDPRPDLDGDVFLDGVRGVVRVEGLPREDLAGLGGGGFSSLFPSWSEPSLSSSSGGGGPEYLVRLVDHFRLEPRLSRRRRLGPLLEVLEQLTEPWPVPSKLSRAVVQEPHELVGLERGLLGVGFQILDLATRFSQLDHQSLNVFVERLHLFEVVSRKATEAGFQHIPFLGRREPDRVDLLLAVIVKKLNVMLELGVEVGQVHRPVHRAVSSPTDEGMHLLVPDEQTPETHDRVEHRSARRLGGNWR